MPGVKKKISQDANREKNLLGKKVFSYLRGRVRKGWLERRKKGLKKKKNKNEYFNKMQKLKGYRILTDTITIYSF